MEPDRPIHPDSRIGHVRSLRHLGSALCVACTLVAGGAPANARGDGPFHPVAADSGWASGSYEALASAIGESRIVLLGENGHGVGEFTTAKVRIVEWLHAELGFDVVVFESGFFECGSAWSRLDSLTAREALYACLRYPFQHAEVLPLFEWIRAHRDTPHPLVLAGMDPQAQGYDSEGRPSASLALLAGIDGELGARVAVMDSALFLPDDRGGVGEGVYEWVRTHGDAARAAYGAAAAATSGWERWMFRLAVGLVDRLSVRAEAEAAGGGRPPRYYELRDEWMARAVSALADSIAGPRKVVVWLHNDHARYALPQNRSVGSFLKEWYGEGVFSMGFFMGRGATADNGRTEHPVEPLPAGGVERFLRAAGHPAGYLILRRTSDPAVAAWAAEPRAYLRMGVDERSLVPAKEFDALYYVDEVGPPAYRIP